MKNIILGQIYTIDVGGLYPIRVRPFEFTENGVKCEYLDSTPGRVEMLSYGFFHIPSLYEFHKEELPEGWLDWNTLSPDQMVEYLKNKFQFDSSGTAKCIFTLIEFYEKYKNQDNPYCQCKELHYGYGQPVCFECKKIVKINI
jgi:hypothetical protein